MQSHLGGVLMDDYKHIRDFEERLKSKYQKEFADEQALAGELFNLYLEAVDITGKQWYLEPERRATFELMSRLFNDLHAGWKLIMEGISGEGMTLLRDTIECAHYIKLFEVDTEFRDKWLGGTDFFLRDVRQRMKKKKISPPPQDRLYKTLSQTYTHPSKKGTAWHVADLYPVAQKHEVVCMYGGVEDIPRTRFAVLTVLTLTYVTIYFLWQEMFPIDADTYPAWHGRLAAAEKQLRSLEAKTNQELLKFHSGQLATTRKILDEYFRWFFQY